MAARFILSTLALASAVPLGAQPRRRPPQTAEARSDSTLFCPPARRPACPPTTEPGSELTVYLVTMGPGDRVWERFGHNAIWIRDRARGTDIAYNWGLFDFDESDFLPRFLSGTMLYWMGGFPVEPMLQTYVDANRSVWVQELRLTPAQRAALREFVEWNERPENRYYRYDYYRDNCSTRVRDAIDRAVGGQLRAATATRPTGSTYRTHTQQLTEGDPAVYTGTMLGLGQPVDRPISAWEEMFLPMKLRDHLRDIRVIDASGRQVPLVQSERQLFAATRAPVPERPPRFTLLYLAIGTALGAVLLLFAEAVARGSHRARLGLAALGGLWSLLAGVLGVAIALLWTVTQHIFTYRNENVLQFTPLSLVLAVLLPLVLYKGRGGRLATRVAAVILILSALGFFVQVLPGFDQTNGEIIALALPVSLGMALAVRRVSRSGGTRPA